jgi:glycerophosphoryl diester phosphodiesterase
MQMERVERPSPNIEIASHNVICYGHRGARGHAPENTLLSFAMAFDVGADAVECDVQLSRDGYPVIIHDLTVDRTTDGRGLVQGKTLAELRTLNAGRSRRVRERIPRLEEVLELVQRRCGEINLEIKGRSVQETVTTAAAILPVLEDLPKDFRPQVLVSSFAHPAVALLKEELSWLRVGLLIGREWKGIDTIDMITLALACRAEAIHLDAGPLTEESVAEARQAGLRVNVWTANSRLRIRRLLSWQVDGIFTDFPEKVVILRALMQSPAEPSLGARSGSSVSIGEKVMHGEVEE